MVTALLVFFPLIAAILLLFTNGEQAKKIALASSLIEFLLSVFAISQFQPGNATQFAVNIPWIHSLGISFNVGMDGISLLLVLLTTLLVPLIILSSFYHNYKNPSVFYSLILTMQMALVGVFVSLDGFLFYIFWELALIPIYFICLLWGGENRARITFKFFVYTLLGSLFMLVALIYLYLHSDRQSFDIESLYQSGHALPAYEQSLVFWALFIAFAIKMPVFPFHTWQPDTYAVAPTQGTMLLSGIMLKMGTYGLIRWLLPVVPLGVREWASTAILLSVIGIIYASCIAIVQKDMKRLIAYSSIAHVGLISAGILSMKLQGIQGGLMQMLSHGINVVGLFLAGDVIFERTRTHEIAKLGGIRSINSPFATWFMIILLGSVALPLTNGFIGEFLLISGLYQYNAWIAAVAGLTIILGAVYMLRTYQSVMLGEKSPDTANFTELKWNEKVVLMVICILVIVMGVYPKPLLDISEPAVIKLLSSII